MSSIRLRHTFWTLLALAAGVIACGSEKSPTQPAAPATLEGQYKGTMAGGPTVSASLDLMVAASITGTIKPVGAAAIPVTGTYAASSGAVALSGGGFTIAGTIDNTGSLLATSTHSSGAGNVVAYQHTTANPVTVFCGTYTGDADGIWNLARRGASLSGAYVNVPDGSHGYLPGTVTGSSISITVAGGGTATGTLSGTTMSGTWSGGGVYGGTWTSNTTC